MKVAVAGPLKLAAKLVLCSRQRGRECSQQGHFAVCFKSHQNGCHQSDLCPPVPLSGLCPKEKKLNNIHENIHDSPFIMDKNQ